MTKGYLSLIEYSVKYNVSISTLRRRIKKKLLDYVIQDGKYLIRHTSELEQIPSIPPASPLQDDRPSQTIIQDSVRGFLECITQKEFEITRLKNEIVDLQMLVKLLEEELARLKARQFADPTQAQI